jgi:hypothetical protein
MPIGPRSAADLETVVAGHHHVEDDEVGRGLEGLIEGVATAGGRGDVIALGLERGLDDHDDIGFVVDNEDAVRHGGPLSGPEV